MKKGLTLVELLVSLTIFGIILAAILSIYFYQQRRAVYVQETSIMQTDAQVAFELIKRDIMHSGLGLPSNQWPISGINGGTNSPDEITLYGAAFFTELENARWNPVIRLSTGGVLICKNWGDTTRDIRLGDTIVILSQYKNLLYDSLVVTNVGVAGNERIITVNNPNVRANAGSFAFRVNSNTYVNGVRYWLDTNNDILMRNNQIFLENVEDFQIAYGFDWDGDSIIDTTTEYTHTLSGINLSDIYSRPFMIRVTILTRTGKGITGFEYPFDSLRIEDRLINIIPEEKRFQRIVLRGIVSPRNLRG